MTHQAAKRNKIVIVSGPSGAGKTSICRRLVKKIDAFLSISATTRPKGPEETDGVDYYFLSKERFQRRIRQGEFFMEYAKVFGNYYGTPKQPVTEALHQGKTVILEIDPQGALQVKRIYRDALMIFVLPPSQTDLARRLTGRSRESQQARKARLNGASNEIAQAREHYGHMVINDELEQAVDEIIQIVKNTFTEELND
jgi:guanylate kinase